MKSKQSDTLEPKQKKQEEKKPYRAPAIVYREALEVSASFCDPGKENAMCAPQFS